jgi:hypothetical protein
MGKPLKTKSRQTILTAFVEKAEEPFPFLV